MSDYIYIYPSCACIYYTRNPIRILIDILAKIPWTHNNINLRDAYDRKNPPPLVPRLLFRLSPVWPRKFSNKLDFFFIRVCALRHEIDQLSEIKYYAHGFKRGTSMVHTYIYIEYEYYTFILAIPIMCILYTTRFVDIRNS